MGATGESVPLKWPPYHLNSAGVLIDFPLTRQAAIGFFAAQSKPGPDLLHAAYHGGSYTLACMINGRTRRCSRYITRFEAFQAPLAFRRFRYLENMNFSPPPRVNIALPSLFASRPASEPGIHSGQGNGDLGNLRDTLIMRLA